MTTAPAAARIAALRLPSRPVREIPDVAPLSPRLEVVRASLVSLCVISVSLILQLTVVSSFQQRAAQQRAFDRFRADLAQGVAPVGPTDADGRLLAPGTPVAYVEVPSIGLRQVVAEGTSAETLFAGPGHRRDTPLPGQAGTSLVAARRSTYGGPFARIAELGRGDLIHVTTGQGAFDYRVIGVRRAGDRLPRAVPRGAGRLVLATGDGGAFLPSGVVWVDADLAASAAPAPGGRVAVNALPSNEKLMASSTRTLWALALWLQAVLAVVLGGMWAWLRWGRAKAWLVFVPPLLLGGLSASGEAAKLLPNLL